ncbi:MAG: SpoIID/LytB domain-containing protein [Symbiobacteriia bacterium]
MKLRRRLAAFCLTLLLATPFAALSKPALAAADRTIRVGLGTALTVVHLSADGAYTLVNTATGGTVMSGQAGQVVAITVNAQGLAVTGFGTFTGPLRLKPAATAAGQPGIGHYEGKRYRGVLDVSRAATGQMTVVNELNLEDYLLGVVPKEMPTYFPTEALKAQAVAARTYAAYQTANSKYAPQGFDVVDTTDSQVYGGVNAEDPLTTTAVQATRGIYALYNGQPINAFFHASGGGYTENSENVFSSAMPYLRGVPDFDQESPKYNWTVSFALIDLQQTLAAKGYDAGTLYGIEPAGPQGVSGRWTTLALVGSKGRLEVKATQLRLALGLNSTLFAMVPHNAALQDVRQPIPLNQPVTVLARDGQRSLLPSGTVVAQGAGGTRTALAAGAIVVGRQAVPASIELNGHGWGHGVGLSQWGASGMAKQGNTYDAILRHYYTGTTVGLLPGATATN